MIIVRGVYHGFILQFWVRAWQHGNHIIRFEGTNLTHHLCLKLKR